MRQARRDRWLTLVEVADLMQLEHPKRAERRRYVRRIVRRAELRDEETYTKRVGRCLYVSVRALETLLPWKTSALTELERSVAKVIKDQGALRRQVKSHGARLRTLEEFRRLTREYLEKSSELLSQH